MTLKEAMTYRGENEETLAKALDTRPLDVRRWCKPGGLLKLNAARLQQLAEALDGACAVPLDLMDACCEGIRLAADYAEKGSVLALSDAGCAALFCKAALQASALNVAINTKLMTDRAHAAALDEKAARMLAEYLPLADEVYQSVASRLRA